MTRRTNNAIRASLTRFSSEEDGGAYTLSYVMVVPIVMLLVCLIVETTLMMSAKLGTVYAAYAGARVASVWSTATTWSQAEQKIEQAAIQAFVPFASGAAASIDGAGGQFELDAYVRAHEAFATKPVSAAYVKKKYSNALASIRVKIDGPPTSWDSDVVVTVTYDCPFRVPGIGRLIGEEADNGGFVFPLTSQATLQHEGPQNKSQELGIGYGTLE